MSDARLEIKAGRVSFVGEGTETWLSEQLDKVLEKLPDLGRIPKTDPETDDAAEGEPKTPKADAQKIGSLAGFLKEKKASTNQSRKFLATAAWLQLGGLERVTTAEVTKTLNTHKQGKLTNPSQCLTTNTTSGNIVKDGKKQFYVTEEGFVELNK